MLQRTVLLSLGLSLLSACSTFEGLKKDLSLFTQSQQLSSQKQVDNGVKVRKISSKVVQITKQRSVKAPSHNCDYIVRDLSVPSASAVWCVPE